MSERDPQEVQEEVDALHREARRQKLSRRKIGVSGRIAAAFLESKLTPLLVVASLLVGVLALMVTPREEEPQIKVPMVDVTIGLPGASAQEVERRVISPIEKILYEIENVEYIYSTSQPSGGIVIVRFYVGTDPDQAITRIHAKLAAHQDLLPQGSTLPVVKPRSIDDVPAIAYTIWSTTTSPTELRHVAEELRSEAVRHPRVAQAWLIGGQRRVVRVTFDRDKLAAHHASILQAYGAINSANWKLPAGQMTSDDRTTEVQVGGFLKNVDEVRKLVIATYNGKPVYLGDVATIEDGPEEPSQYVWMGSGPAAPEKNISVAGIDAAAITLAISKKPGTNAIDLVNQLDERIAQLRGSLIPSNVTITKTRDYGFTAQEKSNELIFHVGLATLSVVLLMLLMLGRREAIVVLVAVPVTLALTLASSYFFGYTLNRVTLFALIFSIGILVDDAIVVVENIHRHYQLRWTNAKHATVFGTDEVGNPTILATLTVIGALLPLAFVSGLMGPYMRPIPVNASAAMFFSLLVAFIVSPWLTYKLFGGSKAVEPTHRHYDETQEENKLQKMYARIMQPLLASPKKQIMVIGSIVGVLLLAMTLFPLRWVVVKMMPYDNKSELQVVIDAPEEYSLERTNAAAREMAQLFTTMEEVTDYQVYVGTSAPFNFNGLVRYYFMRSGNNVADIQVNLVNKHSRDENSHDIAKAVRIKLLPIAEKHGVNLKVTEVPPGPPVLSTMVAEVYGPDREGRKQVAAQVKDIFAATEGIVDIDWLVEDTAPLTEYVVNQEKAATVGITPEHITRTLRVALNGAEAGLMHVENDRSQVPLVLRLERAQRARSEELSSIKLHGSQGQLVPLGELVTTIETKRESFIYHKNLQPVTYVIGEVAGSEESPVYGIMNMNDRLKQVVTPSGVELAVMSTHMPEKSQEYGVKWDGEWHITYEVFRDMGAAFGVVVLLIYVLVVGWFGSFITPLIIMAPIPLTLIGILPGHALLGTFFTATSMIGFIALSGIVVRNSILLVDFINQEIRAGESLENAVLKAGAVRFRPITLTALSLVVGAGVIYLDPIFQGLAVSLIFGVIASTALTLVLIPLLYYIYLHIAGTKSLTNSEQVQS